MKMLGKTLVRYVMSAAGVALLLILLNFVIAAIFVVSSYDDDSWPAERKLSERVALLRQTESGWEAEGSLLEGRECWAMLLSEEGDVLWEENLPKKLNRHYTVADVASFTRWYLDDYPVQVWKREKGLFVVAQPRGSQWKQLITMPLESVELLARTILPACIIMNIAAAFALAMLFGWRLYRSAKPVAQGIADLAEKKPVCLAEKGMLGELSASLNRASEQLQRQEELLSRRDRTRTEWIAGVSHDIRTPLTLVVGEAAQLEADENLNQQAKKKAKTIRTQGERIRTLVADLNLASKLEYELQPLRMQSYRPAELLRTAAAAILNESTNENHPIELQIAPATEPLTLTGDPDLLERALRNLVTNSIRHNPQGCKITLTLQKESQFLRYIIEDTGKGIPYGVLERMRRPREEPIPAHGLGLTIVRQIASAHGGAFGLENTPTGSRATFTLPLP